MDIKLGGGLFSVQQSCFNRINMIRYKWLNDTNMIKLSQKQQKIAVIILQNGVICL